MRPILNPALGVKKIGSIGIPLPDVEARIVDPTREIRYFQPVK
jgi:hypothetical protein